MAEQTPTKTTDIEKNGHALIARLHTKLLEDDQLKALIRLVDDAVAADPGIALVILDMTQVSFIPSMTLGLLVQISNKCKTRQQALKLAGIQPSIRQVLSITRLDRLFQIASSVTAALE